MGNCCAKCKNPFLCANRHCICHLLQLEHGLEGRLPYSDPVGNEAVNNASQRRTAPKRNRQNR